MSASAKKKLRKEQEAAKFEQKQLKEKKEARKLKAGSTVFIVVLVAILVAAIAIGVYSIITNTGIIEKNTVAATVGDHQISALEASFYYNDTLSNSYNNWVDSYGDNLELYMMFTGLDLSLPLDEQKHPSDENLTWADYFINTALDRAKSDHLLYEMAVAEGHTMTEAEQEEVDSALNSLQLMALYTGYNDVGAYLHANYGPGANMETYREYCTKSALATSYYNAHAASLTYDDAAISAYVKDKELDYTAFSYASYLVTCSEYMTGGSVSEDDTIVYTDAEKEAGRVAAETVANQLASYKTVETLDKAIAALPINANNSNAASTHYEDTLYRSINSTIRGWLAENGRVNGDTTVIPLKSTENDVTGYYVVLFEGRNENERPLANVRHLLVNFVSETASSTYTDEEKAAAKAEAEKILQEMKDAGNGVITDAAFAAKATELTDDTASAASGGLYEDILPVQGIYEENFTNWAIDPARKAGDTGLVETAYGWHIMYYVGDDEMTYRDYLITQDMKAEDMDTWYQGILGTVEVTKENLFNLKTDIVLGG